jgi:hypothetical protein
MVIEPDTVIPIDARVVDVAGYRVDNHGRILGKGHATRDVVLWTIPILWPIDLLMLPMRGPRPTLKEEARLSIKMMDDLPVPATEPFPTDSYGLRHRETGSVDPPPPPVAQPQPAPQTVAYAPVQAAPPPPAYWYYPVVAAPMFYMPMVMPMVMTMPVVPVAPPAVAYSAPPAVAYSPMQYAPPPAPYGYASPGYPTAYGYNGYGPRPARESAYQMAYYGTR